MRYEYEGIFHEGTFLSRPNRFLAELDLDGELVLAHVNNTGRMDEILVPGNTSYIREAQKPNRKTKYDLISIISGSIYVNLDSQIPNKIIADAFLNSEIRGYEEPDMVKREVTIGGSRLDMVVSKGDRDLYVEVKGVDLIINGQARFPDAVTKRGTKHLRELEQLTDHGHEAMVVFLVQRNDADSFMPNYQRDPEFAESFYQVIKNGVKARAYLTEVGPDYIELANEIPIENEGVLKFL